MPITTLFLPAPAPLIFSTSPVAVKTPKKNPEPPKLQLLTLSQVIAQYDSFVRYAKTPSTVKSDPPWLRLLGVPYSHLSDLQTYVADIADLD